jgi:hypothetical protein
MGNTGFLKYIRTAIDFAKLSMCLEYTNNKTKNKLRRTASGVPVCWFIVAGHLEVTFHRQNRTESYSLLFLSNMYVLSVIYCKHGVSPNFNRASLKNLS